MRPDISVIPCFKYNDDKKLDFCFLPPSLFCETMELWHKKSVGCLLFYYHVKGADQKRVHRSQISGITEQEEEEGDRL